MTGTCEQAEDIRTQVAAVCAPMGLQLSVEKTAITHIDEGLDFLGWRLQRHRKRGTQKHYIHRRSRPGERRVPGWRRIRPAGRPGVKPGQRPRLIFRPRRGRARPCRGGGIQAGYRSMGAAES
ncbi:hypothetical protein [Streptomyces sp. NPDC058545]|uniref:hypothetical protein n=1 Tax=Streptomyces sp. NPDC058545 TaxID=3346544 RepID=UPI00365B5B84